MTLYEITDGMEGFSYVRAYAWAHDEDEALLLYQARHGEGGRIKVRSLFDSDSRPFITEKNDHGWPDTSE